MEDVTVRVAGAGDVAALASLRAAWAEAEEPGFAQRMAGWLDDEGARRTTWLAERDGRAVGMASRLRPPRAVAERARCALLRAGRVRRARR